MPASKLNVDFSNVSEGGNFRPKHKEPGEYTGRIVKVEDDEVRSGDNKGNPRWAFTIKIDGDERASYPYYCGHSEKEFWKIRAILVAAGITVPKRKVAVDPNKVVGKAVGVILDDHEWNDKLTSAIDELIPVADIQDPLNDGDAPTSRTKRSSAPVGDDVDVEDEYEDDAPPPPKKRATRRAPEPVEDEDEYDDEPPRPTRRRKPDPEDDGSASAPRRRRAAPVEEDEDDAPPPRKRATRRAPVAEDEYEDDTPPPRKREAKRAAAPVEDDDDLDLDEI